MAKPIIFTDLDGTLLDHKTYSFDEARPALKKISEAEIPLVFVTSKTFAEVEAMQKKMGIWGRELFIVENGGAIFVPETSGKFHKIEFGKPYSEVRRALKEAAEEAGVEIKGIGDMTAEEFAADSGLSVEDARRAKQRMYQEGFRILSGSQEKIKEAIEKKGLFMSIGGRYCQISGQPAKIKAVKTLIELFRKKYGEIQTIGFGDAQSDLEFLELCDRGYLVKNPYKAQEFKIGNKKIHQIDEIGPAGFNKVVLSI